MCRTPFQSILLTALLIAALGGLKERHFIARCTLTWHCCATVSLRPLLPPAALILVIIQPPGLNCCLSLSLCVCLAGAWCALTSICRILILTSAPPTAGLPEPTDATRPRWRWESERGRVKALCSEEEAQVCAICQGGFSSGNLFNFHEDVFIQRKGRRAKSFFPFSFVQFDINVPTQPCKITESLVFITPCLLQSHIPIVSDTRNLN